MWKLIGQPKSMKATHALADRFAKMEPAPGDRILKSGRVEKLKKAVTDKTFRTCEWASAFCKETKTEYRVNGKHTSTLFSELNGELKGLSVIVEQYECDTLQDVARLYATFDTRTSVRSTGDINAIFAGSCDSLEEVPPWVTNLCVSGMAFSIWGDGGSSPAAEDRAALIPANVGYVLWVQTMLQGVEGFRILKRAPAAAAMYATYEKDKKAAKEFWALVRDGSGPDHRSPDRKLNKYLLTAAVRSMNNTARVVAGRREMYVKCLHAWNAWRRGAATDLKFYPNVDDPKVV